jgi:hypothetical protein
MGAGAAALLWMTAPAMALQFDTGNPDFKLRWDNNVKYSSAYRLRDADPALASDPNQGDGDTNFRQRGLISNRLDLLSEVEGSFGAVGARVSGAAWYDTVYNRGNQNNTGGLFGPGTSLVNSTEVANANEFTPYTRATHGRKGELLDAFVSTKLDLGGHATTVRLGQHTVVWGETLFFGDNGIAGAMSPVDVAKALSVPNLRFQEILRPVPQVSGQFQVNSDITAYAFYQLSWRENRSQGSGSYFSPVDFQAGGNLIFTGPGTVLTRGGTHKGKDGGQGGLSLRLRGDDMDYGLYAVRFNSKNPAIVTDFAHGTFYDNYHNGINVFGASANRSLGSFNYAVEASIRHNQDLLSPNAYDFGTGPSYGVGKTAHINVSAFGSNLGKSMLWDDAMLLVEAAYSRVLSIQRGADTLSGCGPALVPNSVCLPTNGTRDAYRFQALFEPAFYQALPGVDLRVPMGVGYQPRGSRNMVGPAPFAENGGSFNIGLSGSYLDVWRAGLSYTRFFGRRSTVFTPVGAATSVWNYGQVFGDRDYLSFNFTRTF